MSAVLKPLAPADAIIALRSRGQRLDPSFSWLDTWQEEHARSFTVAKSAGFDILGDIYKGLQTALEEGRTFREFSRELKPLLQAKGWWGRRIVTDPDSGEERLAQLGSPRRLRTIFETNMRVSYASGHWASFERNQQARPFLRYVAILDEATRPHHRRLHNLVLPVDHPFWNSFAPPNGWNCRCTLQSLSQRDIDRLIAEGEALTFEPPEITERRFVNRRTGEVTSVPDGIDPGWAYNPGRASRQALGAAEKLIDAPPRLAAAVHDDPDWILRPIGNEFAAWFDEAAAGGRIARSMVSIGALERAVLERLGARGIVPKSGAITIDQNRVRHILRDAKQERAAPAEALRRMPEIIAAPRAVLRDRRDGSLIYVFDAPGETRLGKLVIRVDFSRRARAPGAQRQTVQTNAVRTAGMIERRVLTDANSYEVLTGEI